MSVPRIRLETVEAIARKILMEYDSSLLSGEPRPIPIEAIDKIAGSFYESRISQGRSSVLMGGLLYKEALA